MTNDRDLTAEQREEYARRAHQLRDSSPTVLTDKDIDALAHAHHDACVRQAADELITARGELVNLRTGVQLLGVAVAECNSIALEATGTVPDPDRGDGTTGYVDWHGVWEKVAELRPQLDAAHRRIRQLEQQHDPAYVGTAPDGSPRAVFVDVALAQSWVAEMTARGDFGYGYMTVPGQPRQEANHA